MLLFQSSAETQLITSFATQQFSIAGTAWPLSNEANLVQITADFLPSPVSGASPVSARVKTITEESVTVTGGGASGVTTVLCHYLSPLRWVASDWPS